MLCPYEEKSDGDGTINRKGNGERKGNGSSEGASNGYTHAATIADAAKGLASKEASYIRRATVGGVHNVDETSRAGYLGDARCTDARVLAAAIRRLEMLLLLFRTESIALIRGLR
jgi:hypothetical protein